MVQLKPKNTFLSVRLQTLFVCALLAAVTFAVFYGVRDNEFVLFDDDEYIYDNPFVRDGLTASGLKHAFGVGYASNWHPLTWLSHMLDCELYGLDPAGHHLTNAGLHAINAVLLFLILKLATGTFWRSAFVAAAFALHPLRVESVAWAAERKDVLGALFWILTMGTYVYYVQRKTLLRYVVVAVLFALGLMAKPMLITLPFALLLLDYWPLGRMAAVKIGQKAPQPYSEGFFRRMVRGNGFSGLVIEKTPLFFLSAVSAAITLAAQRKGGTVSGLDIVPFSARIGNALAAYVAYMVKTVVPYNLAVLYPHPHGTLSVWQVAGTAAVLAAATALVVLARKRHPYLLTGWLWYLGILTPVIGLVQVGSHALADRYTYIPQIGLLIMAAWGAHRLTGERRFATAVLSVAVLVLLVSSAVAARVQVRVWKDSVTLFEHAIDVTTDNYLMHNNLGLALDRPGRRDEALRHYAAAVRIEPGYVDARVNLAVALSRTGSFGEADGHFREALRIEPDDAVIRNSYGVELANHGWLENAERQLIYAIRIDPGLTAAHYNLGRVTAERGRLNEAAEHYRDAIDIDPNLVEAHNNLANALAELGRYDEAIAHYRKALDIDSGFEDARRNLENVDSYINSKNNGGR